MAFDLDKFESAEWVPRTKCIAVPALSDFFEEGEEPEFEVRGLDSNELHKATSAAESRKLQNRLLKAAAEGSNSPEVILKEITANEETPGEIAKRMEMLVAGSVVPEISLGMAVKLAKAFPIQFIHITNEIVDLTNMGFDYAKPEAVLQEAQS